MMNKKGRVMGTEGVAQARNYGKKSCKLGTRSFLMAIESVTKVADLGW